MIQIIRDTVEAMLDRAMIGRKMSDPKHALPAFARIFMNGRSQAVRLPREFRFDTDKVAIRREGRNVILSPPYADWDDYLRNAPRVGEDFVAAMDELRQTPLPPEDRESFD